MRYVALKHLKWGDEMIAPGDTVPEEEGRNYASLLRSGRIAEVKETEQMTDEELRAVHEKVLAERDELAARVEELKAQLQPTEVDVPEGVVPGETPGWPVDAESGGPLALSDEQRATLADKGITGTVAAEDVQALVEGMMTVEPDDGPPDPELPKPAPEVTEAAVTLAKDNDLDLSTVEGTGKNGVITVRDVRKATAA
jgi:pyruvate/2-oxoglutarate dehydrogenase complex dihydrolipoamide acyltransferase (E2) component